jgi:hypothetical protein
MNQPFLGNPRPRLVKPSAYASSRSTSIQIRPSFNGRDRRREGLGARAAANRSSTCVPFGEAGSNRAALMCRKAREKEPPAFSASNLRRSLAQPRDQAVTIS